MATDPLLRRLMGLTWPTPALDHPDPAPGQLWRAEWAGVACLVVIVEPHHGRTVSVVAAIADRVGDDTAVVAVTRHGLAPSVWTGVSAAIKMFTLEHRITDLTGDSFAGVTDVLAGRRRGEWAAITSDLDDRILVRADLRERLRALADAEWQPAGAGDAPTVGELAAAAGLQASSVADALGVAPGDARRLLQGRREPSPDELSALSDLLGSMPATGAAFDDDLVADLDLPEFRPPLSVLATNEYGGDELAARRAFAGRMMALAVRHREPGRRNWVALIRETLRED